MNKLKQQYSKLSDNELLIMVYFESSDYTSEAIEVAKLILNERGLSHPSSKILQQVKNSQIQTKELRERDEDIFGDKKLKQVIKKRDYYFISKWLFLCTIGYGIYSALFGIKEVALKRPLWPAWMLFLIEIVFTIVIFGIIPVIFFCIYSLKLSPKQRKEKGLTLLMPKYVLFIYGISLLLFAVLVILPRL